MSDIAEATGIDPELLRRCAAKVSLCGPDLKDYYELVAASVIGEVHRFEREAKQARWDELTTPVRTWP
jgi:hypothetical protein